MLMQFLGWYGEHFVLGIILLLFVSHFLCALMSYATRLILVSIRGWPINPEMDADGSVCEKCDCKDEMEE